jgi:hypothetical protein
VQQSDLYTGEEIRERFKRVCELASWVTVCE